MGVTNGMLSGFLEAKRKVIEAGYESDIEWAESLADVKPTTQYVLSEHAWVVLNSGFRYAVARKLFPALSEAFGQFEDAERIASFTDADRQKALKVLRYERKIDAIIAMADHVDEHGIDAILADAATPLKLTRLPFIGKITCYHFAKILGADVAKPDVHLQRAADACSMSVEALCAGLAREAETRITVVDSVLWRYGEQRIKRGWEDWPALFSIVSKRKENVHG